MSSIFSASHTELITLAELRAGLVGSMASYRPSKMAHYGGLCAAVFTMVETKQIDVASSEVKRLNIKCVLMACLSIGEGLQQSGCRFYFLIYGVQFVKR